MLSRPHDLSTATFAIRGGAHHIAFAFPAPFSPFFLGSAPQADYDPERFSALIYKMATPKKLSLKVFSSGMVSIEGATNLEMLHAAFEKLYPEIEACKLNTAK